MKPGKAGCRRAAERGGSRREPPDTRTTKEGQTMTRDEYKKIISLAIEREIEAYEFYRLVS
ncbi:MAG TPA: hypothetical protein PLW16_04095, partial [Syntrophales bacterium]|nr:hypothetical protein [Syntrophales bacterium]